MSKTRRKSDATSSDSIGVSKNVTEVDESLTQLKEDMADMQAKYLELDDIIKIQNDKISNLVDAESKAGSPEKLAEVLNLQNKYNELSNSIKVLNEKSTSGSAGIGDKTGSPQNVDETIEVLKSMKKDIGSFVVYGKLFLGIGVAALLLYIINAIISLAASLRPVVG
jgi:chromosome segregation ATPase